LTQRTVQTGIPDEDSDTLLRLSGIEYGLSCRASADRVSLAGAFQVCFPLTNFQAQLRM